MQVMKQMTPAAVERAMKLQDVMLRAMAKRITWYQAAEILGISCRQMLRWQTRFKHEGYEGLFDRRRGVPSPKRVPLERAAIIRHGQLSGGSGVATNSPLVAAQCGRYGDRQRLPGGDANHGDGRGERW